MKKLTIKEFIKRSNHIHKNKYDYSKTKYINTDTKLIIICKKHGKFLQKANHHIRGHGCPICSRNKKLTKQDFIEKAILIHGNKYDYSKVKYNNALTKIIIICPKHGSFLQTPNKHLRKRGCPSCGYRISEPSRKWLDEIEVKLGYDIKREYYIGVNKYVIDGFDPRTNTCYEYNGIFWHGHPDYYNQDSINPRTKTTFGELYKNTLEKEKLIKSAGYNLIIKWGK